MGPPLFLLQSCHAWKTILTMGNSLEVQPRLMLKKKDPSSFSELGKTEKSSQSKNLFMNREKNWKYSLKDQHSDISILNLQMKLERLGPNLDFTVENKTSNLHKIMLLIFQTQWASIKSNFKSLSMNWKIYVFFWKK